MESTNDLNKSMTSFVDIMSILLLCFALITVLLAANINKEYLAKVELLKRENITKTTKSGPGENAVYLTVTKKGKFILEGKMIAAEIKLMSREALRDELKRLSPPKLNMRVDASVPTGKTQNLLLDCQDLGILAFLTTENKKEE